MQLRLSTENIEIKPVSQIEISQKIRMLEEMHIEKTKKITMNHSVMVAHFEKYTLYIPLVFSSLLQVRCPISWLTL